MEGYTIDGARDRERLETFVEQAQRDQAMLDAEDEHVLASPAPWTLQAIPRIRSCGTEYIEYVIRDRRNCCVAVVGTVDAITDGGEAWANARLMRAAPEVAAYLLRLKMDRHLVFDEGFWHEVDVLFEKIDVSIEVNGEESRESFS